MENRGFILLLSLIGIIAAQDCVWNKDTDYPVDNQPLLIDKAPWVSVKPTMESGNRIVRIAEGTAIVVACSGTTIASLGVEVAEGVCTQGAILIGTQSYSALNLVCAASIRNAANDFLGPCGGNNIGSITWLGFDVPGYQFYPIMEICFEPTNQITLSSQYTIWGKSVSAGDSNPDKPSFKDDNNLYPTINPNDCYLTANQDAYVTQVIGDPNLIDLNSNLYFARGHLAANADFLLEIEMDATYWFSNVVPQWQPYNAANWAYLEADSRDLAEAHQVDLEVTTGPWEIMTFVDINSVTTEAWICDDIQQHLIPVPNLMWKTVYDPVLDQGLAVITSNIPNQVTPLTPVCPAIDCMTIPWLRSVASFDSNSFSKGWTYCCTVQDFHAANPHSPDYPTAGLLLN